MHRVKTDPRDATTLCQRLSRYVEGNTRELAVIRVPTEAEEQASHVHGNANSWSGIARSWKPGRSLLVNHSLAVTGALVEKSDLVAFK